MNKELPLVSVVVITYNSAKTVLETLESIKNQTYRNIELIVSDDCSKDNTVEVCKKWLEHNCKFFINSKLVKSAKNTGVAPNLNRGIKQSKGEWIKSIAGDDTLVSNAISTYINFVNAKKCHFCCCDLNLFTTENKDISKSRNTYDFYFKCLYKTSKEKMEQIINQYCFPGPAFFYSRTIYNEVEGFNEKYPMWEEFPFVYSILKKGYDIYPLNARLVNYRLSSTSISREKSRNLPNRKYFIDTRSVYYHYCLKHQIKQNKIITAWDTIIDFEIKNLKYKYINNNFLYNKLNLLYLFSPIFIKKLIFK